MPRASTQAALSLVAIAYLSLASAHSARAQPAMDTLCGTTVTESITLEADVDCTRLTGVAIAIGADGVTLDGNGYRLLAPDATRAIQIAPAVSPTSRSRTSRWSAGARASASTSTAALATAS